MRYKHTVLYHLQGGHLPPGTSDQEVAANSDASVRSVLTNNPDPLMLDGDRSSAVANLILRGLFGPSEEGTPAERVQREVARIGEDRKRKLGNSTCLFFERQGSIDQFTPSAQHETDEYVVCFDGANKYEIRDLSAPHLRAVTAAVVLAAPTVTGLSRISSPVVFFRDDGKPVYSLSFEGSANLIVSHPLPSETSGTISDWYRRALRGRDFDRVMRLLVESLENSSDKLRAFLSAWTSLEIFVNKAFSAYEARFFEELNSGDFPEVRRHYFTRIQSVMKDKHRLADKFALVALLLSPTTADADTASFKAAKDERDALSHGQDVSEGTLPVRAVQELARKYLQLHLNE